MFLRRAVVLGRGPLAEAMAASLDDEPDLHVTVADSFGDAATVATIVADSGVVLSAVARPAGAAVLRAVIEANRQVVDAVTPVADALALHELALRMDVAACVGCDGDGIARLLGPQASAAGPAERLAALTAAALARRLLTGDFRGHWGVWTPERLAARVGMAHGIAQDLRERGVRV